MNAKIFLKNTASVTIPDLLEIDYLEKQKRVISFPDEEEYKKSSVSLTSFEKMKMLPLFDATQYSFIGQNVVIIMLGTEISYVEISKD